MLTAETGSLERDGHLMVMVRGLVLAAVLDEQRLVDRLVANPHRGIACLLDPQPVGDFPRQPPCLQPVGELSGQPLALPAWEPGSDKPAAGPADEPATPGNRRPPFPATSRDTADGTRRPAWRRGHGMPRLPGELVAERHRYRNSKIQM